MTAVLDPVRELDELLSSLAAEDVHARPDEALLTEIRALQAAADRVYAEMLRRLAVADTRGATTTHYGVGTRAWLCASTRMSDAAASGAVRLARALRDQLPATSEGVSTGAITLEQARVIDRHVRESAARPTC